MWKSLNYHYGAFALSVSLAMSLSAPAMAINHVLVESIPHVAPGTTNLRIGVYFTNDQPIVAAVLPLEFRTCDGAYIAGPTFTHDQTLQGRMYNSPLSRDADPNGFWPSAVYVRRNFPTSEPLIENLCPRRSDPSQTWWTSSIWPDFVSPDAILMAAVSAGDPRIGELHTLDPGADPPGVPSYEFVVNVGPAIGRFVIDTTCIAPANTLLYADASDPPLPIYPTFQAGIIGVGVDAKPCGPTACACPCHGNGANCGGEELGILDVITTIDVAFRAATDHQSPFCPFTDTDVNCSGVTDIVDVVKSINVEFRQADIATEYCTPCGIPTPQ